MEKKLLKATSCFLVILCLGVCFSLPFFPKLHQWSVLARENRKLQEEMQVLALEDMEAPAEEIDAHLRIQLPEGTKEEDIYMVENPLYQEISIYFPGEITDYFSEYKVIGKSDYIADISYYYKENQGTLVIRTDKVYEADYQYAQNALYMNFTDLHDRYEKVVVVDAGHGGRAAGAVKQGVYEKDIDLAITNQLLALVQDEPMENVKFYFTRIDDSNPSLQRRVDLANKTDADLFISVHNNSSASGRMNNQHGTLVMYSESQEDSKSKAFAQICLDSVCANLESNSRGLMEGDDIYIIRTSNVPVALIEVGFMTNASELQKLQNEEYQKSAARGIYEAIKEAFAQGF